MKTIFGACSWYSRAEGCLSPDSFVAQAKDLGVERLTVIEHQDAAAFPEWIEAAKEERMALDLGQWVSLRYDDKSSPMSCAMIARDDAALAALYQTLGDLTQDGVVDIRGKVLPPSLWLLAMEPGLSENLTLHQPEENAKWLAAARSTGATVRLAAAPTPAGRYRIKLVHGHLGADAPAVLPYAIQAYFNSRDEFLRSVAALAASTETKIRARAAAGLITGWEHWAADSSWAVEDIATWNSSAPGILPDTWLKSDVKHSVNYGNGEVSPQVTLEQRCRQQLNHRFPGNAVYDKRLQRELEVIGQLGLAAYFLQVADLAEKLRGQIKTLWVRGSAAASLVVYLLGVSQVDPVAQRLLPERFISPSRSGVPDIDLDVPASQLDEARAIALTALPSACRMRVINCWNAHDALQRAVERCLSKEEKSKASKRLGEIAEAFGIRPGLWPKTWLEMEALPDYANRFKDFSRELTLAKALAGFPRNSKLHVSGIGTGTVWAKGLIPPAWTLDTDGKAVRVPAFAATDAEHFGMLKYDLLPTTTLDIFNDLTRDEKGRDFTQSPFSLGMDEAVVRKAMTLGLTAGLPQLNEPTARRLLSKYAPDSFEGLAQFNALIRLAGDDFDAIARYVANSPVSGDLAPYVTPTRGVFIFQEQIMRVAYHLGGLDWAQADDLRAAISKGRPEKLEAIRKIFVAGYQQRTGKPAHDAQKIFEAMTNGGKYVFNRAHAVAYAHLIAWCLFFKATEPGRFLLAHWDQMNSGKSRGGDKGQLLRQFVFDARLFGATFVAQTDLAKIASTSLSETGQVILGLDSVALLPPPSRQALTATAAKGQEAFLLELRKDAPIDMAVKACGFLGLEGAQSAGASEFNLAQKQVAIWGFAIDEYLPGLPVRPGMYTPFKLRRLAGQEGEAYVVAGYVHPWRRTENSLTTDIQFSFLLGEDPLRITIKAGDDAALRAQIGTFPLSLPRQCQVRLARENGVWGLHLQAPMEEYTDTLTPASLWITKLGAAASRIHVR